MNRIAIVGPSGAGKSSLAGELGHILNTRLYYLDRVLWKRDWTGLSEDIRKDILQNIVKEEQWIIEGSYFSLTEVYLEAADIIIFLDMPLFLCLRRLVERHRKQRHIPRRDIPIDSTDKLSLKLVQRVFWFSFGQRKQLMRQLDEYKKTKTVIHCCSPQDVKAYLVPLNGTGIITTTKVGRIQKETLRHHKFHEKDSIFATSKR